MSPTKLDGSLMSTNGESTASECFHLWMHDVVPHPLDPTVALIRIHHPSLGYIDWTDELGEVIRSNRAHYLAGRGMTPRNLLTDDHRAGWKLPALDAKWYMELRWFPLQFGRTFLKLWEIYLRQVQPLFRNHPYAWVNFEGPDPGGIYSLEQHFRSHQRAIERINLLHGKHEGTTPHGHRHAYGQRLRLAKIEPEIRQRCMHHGSLHSQIVYTAAQSSEVNAHLTDATARLDAGIVESAQELLNHMENSIKESC